MLDITCKMCGGRCCQRGPGIASPEDFGAPDREVMRYRIADALHSGRWAIDWWDADGELQETYYLRPAVQGKEGLTFHASWGGTCTWLTDEGCAIYPSRPYGCRDLVSGPPCLPGTKQGTKIGGAKAWLEYQELLVEHWHDDNAAQTAEE